MKNNKIKTINRPPISNSEYALDELALIRYSVRIWLLQENAGLDYLEASVFLKHERPDSFDSLEIRHNLSKEELDKLMSSAKEKFERASENTDVFMGYCRFSEEVIYDDLGRRKNLDRFYKGPK